VEEMARTESRGPRTAAPLLDRRGHSPTAAGGPTRCAGRDLHTTEGGVEWVVASLDTRWWQKRIPTLEIRMHAYLE
jgi:hypothetical protein